MNAATVSPARYNQFIILIGSLGGLLYGVDIGIISAALLYLSKTVNLTVAQTSFIVAAVLGGSMVSSLVAGALADWLGRRRMMILSGLMFLASVGIIFVSRNFAVLVSGRLLQGMSGGVIAVVVPLYLAECLGPNNRGRGTATFQLMLTVGIVLASLAGLYYTQRAEAAVTAAAGNAVLIRAAQDHAWRSMFLSTIYPGLLFFLGTLFLIETPRWLFRKGRAEAARVALLRVSSPEEADRQWVEMEALAAEDTKTARGGGGDSLLQRKYIFPFVLACIVLACNQATGINSVLGFMVVILKQAGLTPARATLGDTGIKLLQCLVTLVAVTLVDRKGRRFLLRLGTGGLVLSMLAAAYLFHTFEAKRVDQSALVASAVQGNSLTLPLRALDSMPPASAQPMGLSVLYSYGAGDKMVTVLNSDPDPTVRIAPQGKEMTQSLTIRRAQLGPIASPGLGWLTTLCLCIYIAFYSIGPGVVVWLTLSELMPTRIRSMGMGIALLLNQGVSTGIAAIFLPSVGHYGFFAMFLFWAACTVLYFLTATFLLPETKGRTLEEIEHFFERPGTAAA